MACGSSPALLTSSLATTPGSTTLTRTPVLAATGARASTKPSTARFAAQQASLNGCPTTPPTLRTVTSRPRLARRCGMAARVSWTTQGHR
ncbi:hypothetical protein RHODO2019_01085 [Rhodococcus antarcticus]|uniref:Uncharacterized protein n=1 Tax=Rhodococcus antarcticus TaxID=2987751 RepID=A0ABY6P0E7_9NOCA|nr:hypothetical protein [Rhodococcus antarcticus]UZJ25137.1 hypothetical protein RHODO2019_01085 [Rhodococcus antarcticus]